MLTVKDRAKPVVERARRIVKHKSRYKRGGGGGEAACETTQRDTPKPTLPRSTYVLTKKTISCCEIISFPVRMSQDSTISRLMLTIKDRAKPVV